MPLFFFPLYYQLLQAYHPSSYTPSTPIISVNETTPTPKPNVLGLKTIVPSYIPPIGGDGNIIDLVLLGDSMIDTLSKDICQQSFQKYFPFTKFNILKYGYGSTNIESALKQPPTWVKTTRRFYLKMQT